MEPKLHRRVQRYGWDRAVDDYERYWVPVIGRCSERCVELLDLKPGERVLDVATGPGVAALMAADRVGPEGEVVATDISEKMVERARQNAERLSVENMAFARADAEELDFPDSSFDAVTCVLGLMFPADPQRAIDQIYRVLRPGGRASVCVWGRRERCAWNPIFEITERRVQSDVCPLFFQLGAEGALDYALKQAGFADVNEERVGVTLDFGDSEQMLQAVFEGGAVAMAYSRFPPEVREQANAEFVQAVKDYRVDGTYHIPGEFVFALARK